jgi:hypothetical protein
MLKKDRLSFADVFPRDGGLIVDAVLEHSARERA